MRSAPRSLVWPSVALLVAVLAAAVGFVAQDTPLQVRRLPDGTVLRLEAVTRGPDHRLVLGRRWQRIVAPLLPPGSQRRIGATTCAYGPTDPSTVVFWLTWDVPSLLNFWSRAVAFNENGDEVEVTTRPFQSGLSKNGTVRGWVVPAFPRRGRLVGLRVFVHDQRVPIAEFRVPNPNPGPHSVWTATPLPASRQDGELTFSLGGLTTGPVAPARFRLSPQHRHWTRAVFRIREHGQPTDRWAPVGMAVSDATGNRIVAWPAFRSQRGGKAELAFCGNLPPSESAWKLRTEFVPTRRFAPGDLWQVRGVPVWKSWPISVFEAPGRKRGVRLHISVRRYGGPSSGFLRLMVRASPRREGLRLALIRAHDDRGRVIGLDPEPETPFLQPSLETSQHWLEVIRPLPAVRTLENTEMLEEGAHFYLVRSPDGAKALDLTFAVVRSRFAEFVVRPARR